MLISADELETELAAPSPPTLLDVRWSLTGPPGVDSFRQAHIPGAVFCDLDAELAGPTVGAGRHPLPDSRAFASAMRGLGVSSDRAVVVYDAADSSVAARAWWCLRYFGHTNVRVLDGGLAAWRLGQRPVEAGDSAPMAAGDFVSSPGGLPLVEAAGVPTIARSGLLIDARAGARYRGEFEPIDPVAGHIPGAVNAPTSRFVDDLGRFLRTDELREQFTTLAALTTTGMNSAALSSVPVAAYCGSGVNAAQVVLAGVVAGLQPSLYVGSWSDWVSDRTRAVAVGAEPG